MTQDNLKTAKISGRKRKNIAFAFVEGIAILLFLLVLGIGALIWRINDAPLDVGFAKGAVQKALVAQDIRADFGALVLQWPDFEGPLLLGLSDFQLKNADGDLIFFTNSAALGLDKALLLIGRVAPEALILNGPAIRVERSPENSFSVALGQGDAGDVEASGSHDALLAQIRKIEVRDARVVVDDRVLGVAWTLPDFDAALENTPDGIFANYQLVLPEPKNGDDKPSLMRGVLEYDRDTQSISFSGEAQDFDIRLLAEKVPELSMLRDYKPILNMRYAGDYVLANKDLSVSDLMIDLGGVVLNGRVLSSEDMLGISLAIDAVEQKQLGPLWPSFLDDENAKDWIIDKPFAGVLKNVKADIFYDLKAGAIDNIEGFFDFENLAMDYRAPLLPVEEATGKARFDYKSETLRIDIDRARISDLNVDGAALEFVDIIQGGTGLADLNIDLSGPLTTGFDYIAREPINARVDFDMAQVKGELDINVNVQFPTTDRIDMDAVVLNVTGHAKDAFLPDVLRDFDIAGDIFDIAIADHELLIKGEGDLSGRPIVAEYQTYLESDGAPHQNRIKAKLRADEDLRMALGIDLSTFLSGPADIDVTYTEFAGGRSEADVRADITPSLLFVDPFDYVKAPGERGEASLKAVLQDEEIQRIEALRGSAPNLSLDNTALRFRAGELSGGKIERFIVADTLGDIDFEITETGLAKIIMRGPVLDLRSFINNEPNAGQSYDAPPLQLSAHVDEMRTSDDATVRNVKLYVDIDGRGRFNQLEMDALAGAGHIYLRYKPDASGERTFRLEADDAGAVLRAFDMYDSIRGGKLVIFGSPTGRIFDRNLRGKAEITNFKIVDAPSLARLLGAMSLDGALGALNGQGVEFSRLASDFEWKYRTGGSLLVLKDGRTSGNSLGLTFEGTFDNAADQIDISGTIIPLSGINNILQNIPVVGNILGGSSGLFAATYSIEGAGKEPVISVNPLSVLAPGILRRILFESTPQTSQAE